MFVTWDTVSSLAVAAASVGAVAVSATSGEVCAAQTHKMEVAITGSAMDKGIISGTIRLGLGTTKLDLLNAFTDPSCGLLTLAVSFVVSQAPHPLELGYYSPPPKNGGHEVKRLWCVGHDVKRLWRGGHNLKRIWHGGHNVKRLWCGGHDVKKLWCGGHGVA